MDLVKRFMDEVKEYTATVFRRIPAIGWKCTYIPEEIFIAAGFIPYRIMGAHISISKAKSYLQGNLNPYTMSCLECALNGDYDMLKGIVIGNSDDASRRLFDAWKKYINVPFIEILDIPKTIDKESIRRYRNELIRLIEAIESHFKIKISQSDLKKATTILNETRRLLQFLNDLRREENQPIKSSEFLEIVRLAMTCHKEYFNKKLKVFLEELVSKKAESQREYGPRILITGSFQDHSWLIEMVETLGGIVVCEDLCTSLRYFHTLVQLKDDILEAISERYLKKSPCARMVNLDRRFEHIWFLVKDFKIDGIIYYVLKFDDPYLFEFPEIKERLRQKGLPVLFIESDHRFATTEQVRTRIQAFIETLNVKAGV